MQLLKKNTKFGAEIILKFDMDDFHVKEDFLENWMDMSSRNLEDDHNTFPNNEMALSALKEALSENKENLILSIDFETFYLIQENIFENLLKISEDQNVSIFDFHLINMNEKEFQDYYESILSDFI